MLLCACSPQLRRQKRGVVLVKLTVNNLPRHETRFYKFDVRARTLRTDKTTTLRAAAAVMRKFKLTKAQLPIQPLFSPLTRIVRRHTAAPILQTSTTAANAQRPNSLHSSNPPTVNRRATRQLTILRRYTVDTSLTHSYSRLYSYHLVAKARRPVGIVEQTQPIPLAIGHELSLSHSHQRNPPTIAHL